MNKNTNYIYYFYLFTVISIWGIAPVICVYFYEYFSPAAHTVSCSFINSVFLTILSFKKLKLLNKSYFKVAFCTGICYSFAVLSQKIGLNYTTPSIYAFLENTSCIAVPVLMYFIFRKRPDITTWTASIICLFGCFVLSGASFSKRLGIGELLCGLAGILYSGNIVGTAAFAKKLDSVLYLMIQQWVSTTVSFITMITLNFLTINGIPIEPIVFPQNPLVLILLIVYVFFNSTVCWILRTICITKINPATVTVAMSASSVITMVISIILGIESFTLNLAIGASAIFISMILPVISKFIPQKLNIPNKKEM